MIFNSTLVRSNGSIQATRRLCCFIPIILCNHADRRARLRCCSQQDQSIKAQYRNNKFCSEMPEGEDRIACRINGTSSIGFLVCQYPKIGNKNCTETINNEVDYIVELRTANVKTVKISPPTHQWCKLWKHPSLNCCDFLEGWIDKKTGQFQ